jgi:foldase protein PrsA
VTALSASKKRIVAIVLALTLVIVIALVAATRGLGHPGIPGDAVAVVDGVDNGVVTHDAYEHALDQSIARLGLKDVPPPTDPQFAQINDETMQGLLLAIWAEGEASDRGIEITDDDVQTELDSISKSFKTEEEFAKVAQQSKFCTQEEIDSKTPPEQCVDVQNQARLLALERKLSDAFQPKVTVSDADAQDFYDANLSSFQTPATRSVRVILNEDPKQVAAAQAELDGLSLDDPDFAKTWQAAAKKYSQDQASKDRGGLLEGLVQGQGDPQLDEQVFSAPVDELTGPFDTDRGTYLIQVVDDKPEKTQSFDDSKDAIKQQLQSSREQAAAAEVQNDFIAKWQRRTSCIEAVMMQFCSGFVPPAPAAVPGQPAQPTPAPVNSSSPIEPGTATLSIDGNTTPGLPQSPKVPLTPAAAAAGAAGLPPGAVPTGAPTTGAPTTAAPTTGAPPTAAP